MNLNSRYLGVIVLAPLVVFLILGGLPLKIFTLVISLVGLYEFYHALKSKNINSFPIVGYALTIVYYIMDNNVEAMMYLLIFATIILLIVPIIDLKYSFLDASITIFGFIYVGILFSFIQLVSIKNGGHLLVWIIFVGSWVCDTAAYYSGKYLGKKKLCPKVSPKKTIAGAIGGFIGSIIGCGIFGFIVKPYIPGIDIIHYFLIGAICGIMAQFGDLVASSIKRYVGIKDYGNLIPGHGGILDRFDSILFNGMVVFYYLTFVVKLS